MTSWTDYQDEISDAISNSMDVDWSASVGAQAVVSWLNEHRPLSAAPAPEGRAVERACVDFQRAIDDFEADVADVMAEGSERADLWDREIMVNIDALKVVMSAALATREEAPADNVTILITRAQREAAKNSGKKLNDWIGGILQRAVEEAPAEHHERNLAMTNAELIEQALSHPPLEAPAEAGERDYPAEFEAWWATYRHRNRDVADYSVKKQIAFDAFYHAALRGQPPAREDAQPVAWRVTNKATGHDELFWKPLADLPFNRERFSTEPLYTHPAPDALEQIDPATVETAIGGAYDMPDGRKFWIDAPVAREMTNRVLAALQQDALSAAPGEAGE